MASPAVMKYVTYGKSRVRVAKLERGDMHKFQEFTVQLLLEGDFDESFTKGDNSKIVPTDTQKNICYVIARKTDFSSIEEYAVTLTQYMLQNYSQITKATASVVGHPWERMVINGKPHPFSYSRAAYQRFAKVVAGSDGSLQVYGGIRDYTVLKTTESGFVGYPKCKFTTLKETTDRFLSTTVEGNWKFDLRTKADIKNIKNYNFNLIAEKIMSIFNHVFATEYSASVQATQWSIAEKVIATLPQVEEISFRLPNNHIIGLDMSPLGIPDNRTVFVPTNEPHGDITATVGRATKARL